MIEQGLSNVAGAGIAVYFAKSAGMTGHRVMAALLSIAGAVALAVMCFLS